MRPVPPRPLPRARCPRARRARRRRHESSRTRGRCRAKPWTRGATRQRLRSSSRPSPDVSQHAGGSQLERCAPDHVPDGPRQLDRPAAARHQ
jgi:hypothetical protein